ncbi:MAG: hypothetical protein JW850_11610 [Thermoflexales bacterium]|nr:hypothetical protein [Thermoflexales bacterium]
MWAVSKLLMLVLLSSLAAGPGWRAGEPIPAQAAQADNPHPPASPVKLVFVHHSTGGNWLADPNQDQPYGGLGIALRDNNYFVSATNYGWGPNGIGDRTDIPNWPEWFTGPDSDAIMKAVYTESDQNVGDFGSWSRLAADPGGENEIVVFKSCFPNSNLYGSPGDLPAAEANDYDYTVSNAKAVYTTLLGYFATRQDKLFVVITAPPMAKGEYTADEQTPAQRAANARALNDWLVNDWLESYAYTNVAVFDYYNVLSSNGSASRVDEPASTEEPNDAGRQDGNHHRWWKDAVQHVQGVDNNYSAYPTDSSWDSHPTTAGHQKATAEFVPLLNVFYHRWKAGSPPPPPSPQESTQPPPTPEAAQAATPTPQEEQAAAPAPAGSLDDFETDNGYHADGENATIDVGIDSQVAHSGAASLRVRYDIAPGGGVSFGRSFDTPQDWSGGAGVSAWLRADKAGQALTLMLFSGDPDSPTPFELYLETTPECTTGWQPFVFGWGDFAKAGWAGTEGLSELNPARITGYGISLANTEGSQNTGTLWIDDLSMASGAAPAPTLAPEPTPTAAPAEPKASDTPAAPAGPAPSGGACPLSASLMAAGLVLALARRAHSAN